PGSPPCGRAWGGPVTASANVQSPNAAAPSRRARYTASAAETATRTASAAVSVETPRASAANDDEASALGSDSDRDTGLRRGQRLHGIAEFGMRTVRGGVLMVFLLDVHLPEIEPLAEDVARRQQAGQHRVILVVVLVHAVAAHELQVRDVRQAVPDDPHRFGVSL